MKTFANHHADTPHGESHAPISISVLMTLLFVGAQGLIYTLLIAGPPMNQPSIYEGVNAFTVSSLAIAVLVLAFLSVDLRRNRIESHGANRFQFVVFAVAGVLIALFMIFIIRGMQYSGPAA